MKVNFSYTGLLIVVLIFTQGCLGVDRIARGHFTPLATGVELCGDNGVCAWHDYSSRAVALFSSDRKVIWLSFDSGTRIQIKTPSTEGLGNKEGFIPATGISQNFDLTYLRSIECNDLDQKFVQHYRIKFLKRGTKQELASFNAEGPRHNYPCPKVPASFF